MVSSIVTVGEEKVTLPTAINRSSTSHTAQLGLIHRDAYIEMATLTELRSSDLLKVKHII